MCAGNSKVLLHYSCFLVLKLYIACAFKILHKGTMRLKKEHTFVLNGSK